MGLWAVRFPRRVWNRWSDMNFQPTTGVLRFPWQVPEIQTVETNFSSLNPSLQNSVVLLDLDNRQAGNPCMLVVVGCKVRLVSFAVIFGFLSCAEQLLLLLFSLEWLFLLLQSSRSIHYLWGRQQLFFGEQDVYADHPKLWLLFPQCWVFSATHVAF